MGTQASKDLLTAWINALVTIEPSWSLKKTRKIDAVIPKVNGT